MTRLHARVALLAVAALALAGCSAQEEPVEASAIVPGTLRGTVTDAALVPLAGVLVAVEDANASATTDAAGSFALELIPGEYVALARHPDHKPGALRASVLSAETTTLAFTLEPIPRVEPRVEVAEASGYLACRAVLLRTGERATLDCGSSDPNDAPSVAFPVFSHEGLETIVLEVAWDAATDAARSLRLLAVATQGDESFELGVTEGTSPLALPVSGRLVAGDLIVLTLEPAGSFLDEEAGVDAGAAVQQPYSVVASSFYHAAAPGGYTAFGR